MQHRPIFQDIVRRLQEKRKFIQVLLGPRQVGKTTLALQAAESIPLPYHYASADLATLQDLSWLVQQWDIARLKAQETTAGLLIIDEVQKIPNWSEVIKSLWDKDTKNQINLSVMILGSSPWLVQKGLSESLAGRFEIIPITHWSYREMRDIFGMTLDEYIYFGGYPGATSLIDKDNPERWMNYINDALIETTISRDILLMTQVNKPALLRRLFQLSCQYSGQIFSYSKMLGPLQDAGNTTTLAHYLDLLAGAGLICGLQKFAKQTVRQKNSVPKLMVYNTALMSAQVGKTFREAKEDTAYWGRLVESTIGAHLLNQIRGTQIELFYWREKDNEVDFVLQSKNKITAIEVKTKADTLQHPGMYQFAQHYSPQKMLLIGTEDLSVENFLLLPLSQILSS